VEGGAKRRADNVSVGNENYTRSYLCTRRTPPLNTAIILIPYPNPFRDSLRSSQFNLYRNALSPRSSFSRNHEPQGGSVVGLVEEIRREIKEVRSDEERSNELTTQSQATKIVHARTSIQDAPPPQPPPVFSSLIPTPFAIRIAHRSPSQPRPLAWGRTS